MVDLLMVNQRFGQEHISIFRRSVTIRSQGHQMELSLSFLRQILVRLHRLLKSHRQKDMKNCLELREQLTQSVRQSKLV